MHGNVHIITPIYSICIFEYIAHIISYVHLKEDCACVLCLSGVGVHAHAEATAGLIRCLSCLTVHHITIRHHPEPETHHPTRLPDRQALGTHLSLSSQYWGQETGDSNSSPNAYRARTLTHWAVSTAYLKAFSPKNIFYICVCLVSSFCLKIFDGCFRPNSLEN